MSKIARSRLAAVTTIVSHADCPDGVASALIAKEAVHRHRGPNACAEVLFMRYGTKELAELVAVPRMLFVDMTPPKERVSDFIHAGAIVLDHHLAQKEIVASFEELDSGVFADEKEEPGVSGALLAYRELFVPLVGEEPIVRAFAETAGVRDTWQKQDPRWDEACAQAAALRFWPWETLAKVPNVSMLAPFLHIGPTLIAKDKERDARSIAESFRFTARGRRVVCFEGLHTSDIADVLGGDADLVVGWHFFVDKGQSKVTLSFRSRGPNIKAIDIAKRLGGGGHTQAAGATIGTTGESPYTMIARLVHDSLE